jgi:serine/threonine protein phosphatase 1
MEQADTVYVVGDIHGCHKELIHLQNKIEKDAKKRSGAKLLIYLGDYIDRGPAVMDCIQSLIDFRPHDFSIIYLLGNHEQMLLDFLAEKKSSLYIWLGNGGLETLKSYGNKMDGHIDETMELQYDERIQENFLRLLPSSHKDFFHQLKLSYEWGNYFFVHAGIDPDTPLHKQKKDTLLWTRDPKFLDSKKQFEKIIVHGHTPGNSIILKNNRICLDTGVFFSGKLSCIKIEADCNKVVGVKTIN